MIKTAVITISDKGSTGERLDKSGKVIIDKLEEFGAQKVDYDIIPDNFEIITEKLLELSWEENIDMILTSGGTGLAKRDVTPEATKEVIKKEVPGIPEKMRYETSQITSMSYLSRSVAGIINSTLVINLPGSPKAVRECLEGIEEIIPHALDILKGNVTEH